MDGYSLMRQWYDRAQIDYPKQYMSLYAAFNAWYRQVTRIQNDREALNILRRGIPLWKAYCDGVALVGLASYMTMLIECTQREPISHPAPHWNGEVAHRQDWPSLIEYWYRVRCLVMHGAAVRLVYVHLAYETLNIFMHEIIYNTSKTSYNYPHTS